MDVSTERVRARTDTQQVRGVLFVVLGLHERPRVEYAVLASIPILYVITSEILSDQIVNALR